MLRGEWHDVTWADLVRGWAGESLWVLRRSSDLILKSMRNH